MWSLRSVWQTGYRTKQKRQWYSIGIKQNIDILLTVCTLSVYTVFMIRSFADRETEKVYNQAFSRMLPQSIQSVALRKLIMIDNAGCLEDLRVPPANRLEKLDGNRKGQYSIRINDQYRICFRIEDNNIFDVEIVDYH